MLIGCAATHYAIACYCSIFTAQRRYLKHLEETSSVLPACSSDPCLRSYTSSGVAELWIPLQAYPRRQDAKLLEALSAALPCG